MPTGIVHTAGSGYRGRFLLFLRREFREILRRLQTGELIITTPPPPPPPPSDYDNCSLRFCPPETMGQTLEYDFVLWPCPVHGQHTLHTRES